MELISIHYYLSIKLQKSNKLKLVTTNYNYVFIFFVILLADN